MKSYNGEIFDLHNVIGLEIPHMYHWFLNMYNLKWVIPKRGFALHTFRGQLYICDMIKGNESDVANIDLEL